MPPTCSARSGPGRAAHHCRHDVVGIQKSTSRRDAALARRFQVVRSRRAPRISAWSMRRTVTRSKSTTRSAFWDDGVAAAVNCRTRYLGRQLPDKAVSVLDTAWRAWPGPERDAAGPSRTPAGLDDLSFRSGVLTREQATRRGSRRTVGHSRREEGEVKAERMRWNERFAQEADLVGRFVT